MEKVEAAIRDWLWIICSHPLNCHIVFPHRLISNEFLQVLQCGTWWQSRWQFTTFSLCVQPLQIKASFFILADFILVILMRSLGWNSWCAFNFRGTDAESKVSLWCPNHAATGQEWWQPFVPSAQIVNLTCFPFSCVSPTFSPGARAPPDQGLKRRVGAAVRMTCLYLLRRHKQWLLPVWTTEPGSSWDVCLVGFWCQQSTGGFARNSWEQLYCRASGQVTGAMSQQHYYLSTTAVPPLGDKFVIGRQAVKNVPWSYHVRVSHLCCSQLLPLIHTWLLMKSCEGFALNERQQDISRHLLFIWFPLQPLVNAIGAEQQLFSL